MFNSRQKEGDINLLPQTVQNVEQTICYCSWKIVCMVTGLASTRFKVYRFNRNRKK